MKNQLYLETTIPSYLAALPSRDLIVAGHQKITGDWWEKRRLDFNLFISQLVIDEASLGDKQAAHKRLIVLKVIESLELNTEVSDFSDDILKNKILPGKAAIDAIHIAVATVHEMDFIMTWNCAHIANAEIYTEISALAGTKGYSCPVICTPEELMGG